MIERSRLDKTVERWRTSEDGEVQALVNEVRGYPIGLLLTTDSSLAER